jgi:hypothetical protein
MGVRSCMKDTRLWKCVNSRNGKIVKFIILLIIDLVDVVVDWYFYAKVKLIEPGLVYGPPEDTYRWAIFSFCIVSTLVMLIETIQNVDDLKKVKKFPFLTQSLTNFLTIVFEDIPLLILNLMIALCRDGDVSIISLTKASLCIICVIIRFILMILVYWIFEKKKNRFEYICDLISTLGLVIVAIISITIQLLNNFPIDNNGLIKLVNPQEFNRYRFFANKYFPNVGIYMRWPPAVSNSNESTSWIDHKDFRIWLADINEFRFNQELDIDIKLNIDLRNQNNYSNYIFCINKSNTDENCYKISNNLINKTNSESIVDKLDYGYNLKFIMRPGESFKYLMGYIEFNMKTKSLANNNKICYDFDSLTTNNHYLLTYAKYVHKNPLSNSYFKYNEGVHSYSLFSLLYDLNIVDQIWKTGIIGCKTNGDKSPKLNRNIKVLC